MDVINNLLASRAQPRAYLEIGVAQGECFQAIDAEHKLGVDPNSHYNGSAGVVLAKASDTYFKENLSADFVEEFDVIFVDGLHTYEQSLRDAVNAYACLKDGGYLVMHDCVPVDEHSASPEWVTGTWMGEVWKTAAYIQRQTGRLFVHSFDCGVGVVQKRIGESPIVLDLDLMNEIKSLTYKDFAAAHAL
jgi:hypothetical protein